MRTSFRRMRRLSAWIALAITLLAVPGSAVAACGCMPRTASAASRCVHCGPRAAAEDASPRLQRASCCGARTVHRAPAVVSAPVELDRTPSSVPVVGMPSVAADPGLAGAAVSGRAPPGDGMPHAPPAPYLENFLRL